jgi:DNA-binding response OmpR family regulator
MKQQSHRVLFFGLARESALIVNLKDAGYLVTALDAYHIPARVNYHLVDLTIIDGAINNYAYLCQKTRQLSNAPILFLLSPHDLTVLSSPIADGIDRFLYKPLNIPEVLAHVQALLRRSDWQRTHVNSYGTETQCTSVTAGNGFKL